jgi:RNA polymerase sigma-70 factor (ECF subfamily)
MALPSSTRPAAKPANEGSALLSFDEIYDRWFDDVSRWIRALGGPDADLDDLTQEVFVVVRRKLDAFDGRNPGGWLYRIAARTVSDYRRRAWFRNLFQRRSQRPLEALPARDLDPDALLQQKEARRTLQRLLDRMSEKRRSAFLLFEVEGLSGEEIAALQEIPVATVWTRLHHARREFLEMVAALRREEEE